MGSAAPFPSLPALIASLPHPAEITDARLRILAVNAAYERLFGYTAAEVVGRSPSLLRPDGVDAAVYDQIEAHTRSGAPWVGVLRCKAKTGALITLEVTVTPLRDDAGEISHFFCQRRDVTARLRAERGLRESEERFRTLVETLPVGILVHRDGVVLYANASLGRTVGRDPHTLPGTRLLDGVPTGGVPRELHDRLRRRVERVIARSHEGPLHAERLVRDDGSTAYFDVQSIRVSVDGLPTSLTLMFDTTDRHELEARLRVSEHMEAVGRLAGGIAHDFNNLLFVILNDARFLTRVAADEALVAPARRVATSAEQAARLTKQLLLFARGSHEPARELELVEVVTAMQPVLAAAAGPKVDIVYDPPPRPLRVVLARSHVEQVLLNLVVNACDAMHETGGRITISTSLHAEEAAKSSRRAGVFACLAVRDTGRGMPDEIVSHIFEPFFTTREAEGGTGLGLAILYGIVTRAGGFAQVESALGRGTTFKVFLPLAPPKSTPPPPDAE